MGTVSGFLFVLLYLGCSCLTAAPEGSLSSASPSASALADSEPTGNHANVEKGGTSVWMPRTAVPFVPLPSWEPEPRIVWLPDALMLAVETTAKPNAVGSEATELLFETYRRLEGLPKGFKHPPHLVRWPSPPETPTEKESCRYGILAPPSIEKLPEMEVSSTELRPKPETWEYGSVAEILHVGPWDQKALSTSRLVKFIEATGSAIAGEYEEVYLTVPPMSRLDDHEKHLTIIRYRVNPSLAYMSRVPCVRQDHAEAAWYWYRKAAEHGHTEAQFRLAAMYDNGDGQRQDRANAETGPVRNSRLGLQDIIGAAQTWQPTFEEWWGKLAPDFTLTDIAGNVHKVSSYRGKEIVLVIWATWCPTCKQQIPHLKELRKAYGHDELAILSISNEPPACLKEFAAKENINYTVLLASRLPAPFGEVRYIPSSFYIDPEGKFKLAAVGLVPTSDGRAIVQASFVQDDRAGLPPSPERQASEMKQRRPAKVRSYGTGMFIHSDGLILTAEHIISDATEIEVQTVSGRLPATAVFRDTAMDIAVLKAARGGPFSTLPVASSFEVAVGDRVFTIGFPNVALQGTEPKYTEGTISSLSGPGNTPRYFQISVPLQPGNSGGPLVDERGNVVGMVNARLNDIAALAMSGMLPQNVNYAVKSAFILPFLQSIQVSPASASDHGQVGPADRSVIIEKTKQALVMILCY